MKHPRIIILLAILVISLTSYGQRRTRPLPQRTSVDSAIRRVDFLNFTYPSSLCAKEYGEYGIRESVEVRNGEFKNEEVYFFVHKKVIYDDVTGDGREDAIVQIDCGLEAANFRQSEIFIYTLENGRAKLLAELDDKDMDRDYNRYYPNGALWSGTSIIMKVKGANLVIQRFAEGSHAAPEYIVTMNYRVNGANLTLRGKPQRRKTGF